MDLVIIEEEEVINEPKIENIDENKNKQSRDINIRLGVTMTHIMEILALKNELQKAMRFRNEAEKYVLAGTKNDK